MKKNLIVITIATFMMGYSILAMAQQQEDDRQQGQQQVHRHGPPHMDATTRAAFETCLTENNLTKPEPGQRPSEEDRKKMDTCLKAKGVSMPQPPDRQAQDQSS